MSPLSSHNRYPPYPEPQPLPHFDGPAFSCFFVLTAAPEHVTATSEVQRWQSATAATSGPLESVCLLHVGRQPDVQQNAVSNPKSKLKTVVQTHVFPYFSKKSAHMCNVKWCVPCWLDDFKQNVFQNSKRSNPPGNYGQILKSTIVPPKGERPFSICMTHVWTKQSKTIYWSCWSSCWFSIFKPQIVSKTTHGTHHGQESAVGRWQNPKLSANLAASHASWYKRILPILHLRRFWHRISNMEIYWLTKRHVAIQTNGFGYTDTEKHKRTNTPATST